MGLIAWYPLDGDARDAVGGRHGEIVGNVDWTDGKLGKAASTAYGRHYIRVPHDPELSAKIFGVVPKVTLAAWVKLRSYNNYGLIIGKNSGGSFSNTTNAIWVNSSEVRFVVGSNESSNPSGSTAYAHAGASFTLNTWHHVAAVLDGDWMGLYVDGVLVDSGSSVLARERSENTADMVIGGPRAGGNEGVDGEIQDVRIYDHALSPREVRDLSLGPVHSDALMQREIPLTADVTIDTGISTSGYLSVGNNFSVVAELTVNTHPAPYDLGVILGAASTGGMGLIWRCTAGGQFQIGGFARSESASLSLFLDAPVGERIRCVYTHDVENNTSLLMVNDQRSSLTAVAPGAPIRNIANRPELRINAADIFGGSTNTWNRTRIVGTLHQASWFNEAMTADEVEEFCLCRASIDSEGSVHTPTIQQNPRARYIRDWLNGNTANSGNHWNEVRAVYAGENISLGKPVTASSGGTRLSKVTDGTTSNSGYAQTTGGIPTWVQVDLEEVREIDEVQVWHHNSGGRTYHDTKTEISEDGINWTTIFDSAVSGTYPETSAGVVHQAKAPGPVGATPRGLRVPDISEVGVTRGLVAWYPLVSDTLDYAGVNHAENSGAVLTAEGYAFESSAYLRAAAPVLPSSGDGVEATISAWIMPGNFSGEGWIVSQYAGGGDLRFIWNTTSSGRMRYFIGGSSISGASALATNTWVHVCVTRKADGAINLFLNGQPDGSGTLTDLYADTPLTIGNSAGGSGASLAIRDVRIHNVALTPEEIAIQAKLALNPETKSAMTQSCLYTNGQIKEVIA